MNQVVQKDKKVVLFLVLGITVGLLYISFAIGFFFVFGLTYPITYIYLSLGIPFNFLFPILMNLFLKYLKYNIGETSVICGSVICISFFIKSEITKRTNGLISLLIFIPFFVGINNQWSPIYPVFCHSGVCLTFHNFI